jgi:hypothetical protein
MKWQLGRSNRIHPIALKAICELIHDQPHVPLHWADTTDPALDVVRDT